MSTKIWTTIGWIATTLVVIAVPYALIDGVMGIFILNVAIVVGGISGVGLNATAKFGIATILATRLLALIGTHYSTLTGFRSPQIALVLNAILIFALPILISATLLFLGVIRRRYSDRHALDS